MATSAIPVDVWADVACPWCYLGHHRLREAIAEAESTSERTAAALRESGARARATTGESEPLLALQDALATFPADRVVVFVRDEDAARYREDDMIGEAERRFGVPVTEVAG